MMRLPVLLLVAVTVLAASTRPAPMSAAVPAPEDTSAVPGSRAVVRTGDPAPVGARVPGQLWRPRFTHDGGILFTDLRTALYRTDAGGTSVLAYVGERFPGGTIASVSEALDAPDGSVIALAGLAAGGSALLRLPTGGGTPETLLESGQSLVGPTGTVTVSFISFSPAIDALGRVVVTTYLGDPPGVALVRVPPSGAPEVLLRDGDPLGGAMVRSFLSNPAVSPSGRVAFAAELTNDVQVIATLTDGAAPVVRQSFPIDPAFPSGPLWIAGPSINDSGDIAFLWMVFATDPPVVGLSQPRVQRIRGGVSSTIAAPGSPAPDGDTFEHIVGAPPVIDAQGRVLFSAIRDYPLGGLYRFGDAAEAFVETGADAGNGATIYAVDSNMALRSDGTLLFGAWDTTGYALFTRSGTAIQEQVRAGDPVDGPARFAAFQFFAGVGGIIGPNPPSPPPIVGEPSPHLGTGPSLSSGGRMIFDAVVTGDEHGLFVREPDGALSAVAMGGDPAPGGGEYDGYYFSHHSVNAVGTVAFLARSNGPAPYSSSRFLAYGPMAGPLTRLVSTFDQLPDSEHLVQGFPPPSRVNAAGSLAIPLYLDDGTVGLYGWDGSRLVRVAAPGDVVPGDGEILSILTGERGRLRPPLLDDDGNVAFEAITSFGGHALYRAPLRAGGVAEAVRLVGAGDPVEGGLLSPFDPQAYERDAGGRLAFQTPPPGAEPLPIEAATYLVEPGAAARRVIGPGDELPGVGEVQAVLPHLAMAPGERLVHEVAGSWLLASTPASEGFETSILAGPGLPSPDGGTYVPRIYLYPGPPSSPPALQSWPLAEPRSWSPPGLEPDDGTPLTPSRVPDRLASDGENLVAGLARTTAGPEAIVLFDFSPNDAPFALAGTGQVVECAGPAGAVVALDAAGSFDPNGDALTYDWSGPFGIVSGPQPAVTVPLGTWAITLTVRDAHGAASSATVDVTVRDTAPPTPAAVATPAVIWPPDGRMTPIFVSLAPADLCDPAPAVVLTGITVDGRNAVPSNDVAGAAIGTDDRAFSVRARRGSSRDGRTYTATYQVTDSSGNSATASATIRVPSSRRR